MSAVLERLQSIGGVVAEDELRYQCERRGIELNGDVEDLIEKGLVEQVGSGLQAIVPARESRSQSNRHRDWSDEQILDRVRLWALIVGKPPTAAAWSPTRMGQIVEKQVGKLRARVQAHTEIKRLYEAGDWPSTTLIHQRFGSLNAALVIAGFDARSPGRQPPRARPALPPRSGREALHELVSQVDTNRERNDRRALRAALYELAMAAMTEADRLSA